MLSDSFIRSQLVGAAAPVAFKTAVPFLCTAVGKQICSLDSPFLEAAPTLIHPDGNNVLADHCHK